MDIVLNELQTVPEVESYTLGDNISGQERIVTKEHLIEVFGEDGFYKILSGRNDAWYAYLNN